MNWRFTLGLCYATTAFIVLPASADVPIEVLTTEEKAQALGWIKKPSVNLCDGYYLEPDLHSVSAGLSDDLESQPTTIHADTTELHMDGLSYLNGHVQVTQPGRSITSARAVLNRDKKTKEITSIDFYGHVVTREPTKVTVGDHVHVIVGKDQAQYDDMIYRMGLGLPAAATTLLTHEAGDQFQLHGLTAQGKAENGEQTEKNIYVFKNANYSTCALTRTSWHLHAQKVTLDKNTGRGHAQSAVIYAKSIPIAYTPYISFPIDSRRYSGFLFPTFGDSTDGGAYFSVPYYWNLAPNYDMTITPTLYAQRGALFTTKNRFLTGHHAGEFNFGILPDDHAFNNFQNTAQQTYANNSNTYTAAELKKLEEYSDARWYLSLKDAAIFSDHLKGVIDYTYLNDDYLQQDIHIPSAVSSQFLQKASLTYSEPYWHSVLLLQKYQTLHPVTLLQDSNQYARMPDLSFALDYPAYHLLDYLFEGQAVNFYRGLNPGENFASTSGEPTSGMRTNLQPGFSIPWGNNFSYIHPTLRWTLTKYDLSNQEYGYSNNMTRSLSIFDIDSGVYLDRSLNLFGTDYKQTLEPRLFYLNVPYRSQTQIPVFDTNIQSFTFDQLFQTNRFNGLDRIGDANQLSFALTSRILDNDTGTEKSKLGIGRIYYAKTRQVQLCNQYGCQDTQTNVGATSSTERLSPIAGFFTYALDKNWSTISNLTWDPTTQQTNNANFNLQYMPQVNHIINFGYHFAQYGDTYSPPTTSPTDPKNNLSQITLSTAWPLTDHMDGLASWNYNISHQHFQNYLYGVSYNTCCYAMRFALSKTFYAINGNGSIKFNNQFLIQFVLKGLGGVGQQKFMSNISTTIPGYQDVLET